LPRSVALQRLEPIAGWNAQIAKRSRLVEQAQLSQRNRLHVKRQPSAAPAGPDQRRLDISEALNHERL
jgi:hypothetical protein